MRARKDRSGLFELAGENAAWLAPCSMLMAIVISEAIRSTVGVSPPAVILFSTVLMLSSLAGVRVGLTSAALLCLYLLYMALIGAGPPVVTGNFVQLLLSSLAIVVIAFGFGYAMDRNRALISEFERTDAELNRSRDELEKRVSEATTELRLRETRLREAQRVAQIGSFERDLTTNESWWSDESFRIFGIDPSMNPLPYEIFLDRIHPEDRQRVIDLAARAVEANGRFDTHYRIVRPDGRERVVHALAEVRYDEEGNPTKLTGIGQDVTEKIELEREVVAISERERNRIGRDLHDGLGQELTGISLSLQTLSRRLVREKSPHVGQVKTITAMVQNSISETRGFARQLAPEFLAEQGLCAALRSLADEIDELSTASCSASSHYGGEVRDPEIATQFFRIAQEGISNALKHGSAQNIELHYGRDGDSFYLEVLDDGIGIPTGDDYSEGMGIRSMRFRAQALHGRLDVGPRPDGGTRVRCSCPYQFQ